MKPGEKHDCHNCGGGGGDGYTIDSPKCPACKGDGQVPYQPLPR